LENWREERRGEEKRGREREEEEKRGRERRKKVRRERRGGRRCLTLGEENEGERKMRKRRSKGEKERRREREKERRREGETESIKGRGEREGGPLKARGGEEEEKEDLLLGTMFEEVLADFYDYVLLSRLGKNKLVPSPSPSRSLSLLPSSPGPSVPLSLRPSSLCPSAPRPSVPSLVPLSLSISLSLRPSVPPSLHPFPLPRPSVPSASFSLRPSTLPYLFGLQKRISNGPPKMFRLLFNFFFVPVSGLVFLPRDIDSDRARHGGLFLKKKIKKIVIFEFYKNFKKIKIYFKNAQNG
jgi:hypothetical protein